MLNSSARTISGKTHVTHFRYDLMLTSNLGSRASQSNHSTTSGRSTICFSSATVSFCTISMSARAAQNEA